MNTKEMRAIDEKLCFFAYKKILETPAHIHRTPELLIVEKGEVEVIVDGERKTLKAGDGCFYHSFCVHTYLSVNGAEGYVLMGEGEAFARFFKLHNGKIPPAFFKFNDFKLLKNLYNLYNGVCKKKGNEYALFEGVLSILLANLEERVGFDYREPSKQGVAVCNLLKYAEDNIKGDLSLKTVAEVFGYSREHFSKILNKYINEPWGDYINRIRVRRVKAILMTDNELTVLDVAFRCGFESANTFYRAYKKEFGESPKRI